MSDLSRPNHYFHDSLGCPLSCDDDHNHPADEGDLGQAEYNRHVLECGPEPVTDDPRFSGLPASVVETAKGAKCTRCGDQIIESKALTGTVFLNLYVPALGARERLFLCGVCGLAAREWLHPELQGNPMFQAVKTELLKRFS